MIELMTETIEHTTNSEGCPPPRYNDFAEKLAAAENSDVFLAGLEDLSISQLLIKIGVDLDTLTYEYLSALFPKGSSNVRVAALLRRKREEYLKSHPEAKQGRNPDDGYIAYDGRFMPCASWLELTPADKFAFLVGPTCFHYNSGISGYGAWEDLSDKAKF